VLLDGELDAVLGEKSEHPDLRPLFPDAGREEQVWFAKHDVMPINHMVVVRQDLSKNHPDIVREVHRLLSESAIGAADAPRFDPDEMHRSLKLIIDYSAQHGLIPRAFAVEELFDDVTRPLLEMSP
jgi:4,5-dihydroxyphthalate decarboxylase